MSDAILVLNAGSSSLKFTLYDADSDGPRRLLRGQIEGLTTKPSFAARDANDKRVEERDWPDRGSLGHIGAVAYVLDFVQEQQGQRPLAAVGHRVVHGGDAFATPVRIDAEVLTRL